MERDVPLDIFAASGCGQLDRVKALLGANPEQANAVAADGFQPLGLADCPPGLSACHSFLGGKNGF
jgi:hypothetical protein